MKASKRTAGGRNGARSGFAARPLARRVAELARAGELDLAPRPTWQSGVYGLVDAVFRARVRYEAVVRPLLEERLPRRLPDRAGLRFCELLDDVRALRGREAYARRVLNRQRIGARRKVAICCDAAAALSRLGLETRRRLAALEPLEREVLVCERLVAIEGFGATVARHLLVQLGHADALRPDAAVRGFLASLGGWTPDPRSPEDDERAGAVLAEAARRLGTTPARLDLAIHRRRGARSRDGP